MGEPHRLSEANYPKISKRRDVPRKWQHHRSQDEEEMGTPKPHMAGKEPELYPLDTVHGSQDPARPPKPPRPNVYPRHVAKNRCESNILPNVMGTRVDCRLAELYDTADNLRHTSPVTGKSDSPKELPVTEPVAIKLPLDTTCHAPLT